MRIYQTLVDIREDDHLPLIRGKRFERTLEPLAELRLDVVFDRRNGE